MTVRKPKVTKGMVTVAAKLPEELFDSALALAFNRSRARTNAEVVQTAIKYFVEHAPLLDE